MRAVRRAGKERGGERADNDQPKPLRVWHPSPLVTDRSRVAVCLSLFEF